MAWHKAAPLLTLALLVSGCISESVTSSSTSSASLGSSSDSSSSPSKSSSNKKESTPSGNQTYLDDIANLTNSVSGSNMTSSDFMNALARTATQDKISNWESQSETFLGIGKGLKRASVPVGKIEAQPFLGDVLSRNKDALDLIRSGYKE